MNNIPQDDTPRKRCSNPDCHQWLPATPEFFSRNKRMKDGFHIHCKVCDSARKKAYYEANKEQALQYAHDHQSERTEYMRQYRQTAKNKEYNKEYCKQYSQEHLEERRAWDRHYGELHREEKNTYARQYRQTVQGKAVDRAHRHKRRAQKLALGGSHTAQDIQDQYRRQKGKCYWCHKKLSEYHVDHVIPLSRGGSNDISNIVIACPTCNIRRSARLPHEWPEGNRLL